MKIKGFLAGLSMLALGATGSALPVDMTQAEAKVPALSVYGEAEIEKQADRAKVFGVIQKVSESKEEVQGVVDVFTTIQKELEEEGITNENVKTLYFYDTFCNFDGELVYRACLDFCVETEDLTNLREIVDEIQEEGATVKSISYELTDSEAYKEALALATQNALNKADVLVNSEGMQVVKIDEDCFHYCNTAFKDFVDLEGDDLIENITIKAKVKVTMDYVETIAQEEVDKETGEIINQDNVDKETGEILEAEETTIEE